MGDPVYYETGLHGYERWEHFHRGTRATVYVHRLAGVAWGVIDSIYDEQHVHHPIPIPWLNTEWNLEGVPPDEHNSISGRSR